MKKILVIEDNDSLRDNIEEILEIEGFEAAGAQNGQVGIDKAIELLPDLIISDVNMPLVDGFGVLEALRANPETKTIPFVFLTVKKSIDDIRTGMSLGANDYLPKPFNNAELVEVVNKRLQMRDDIAAEENEKYDELKNVVGLPIAKVIDEPLRKIERLANLLRSDTSEIKMSDVMEIAQLIETGAVKLRNDIVKILYFYRVQALKNNGEELTSLQTMTTSDAAAQISAISEEMAQNFGRKADLFVHADDSTLRFPEEFLEFCIKELVENAFKYSARNCPVKVTGAQKGKTYQITIQDQGIGFDGKSIEDIHPYTKISKGSEVSDGLGLGLYNVKHLVQLFDGTIELQAEEGVGTSITLLLQTA